MDLFSTINKKISNCKHAVKFNTVIAILLVLFGISLLAIQFGARFLIANALHPTDSRLVKLLFMMVSFFGVFVIIISVHCIRVNWSYLESQLNPLHTVELGMWVVAATVAVILALVLLSEVPKSSLSLQQHLHDSMQHGLEQYLQDPTWKRFFDVMQPARQCCGVANYSDWHLTSWVPSHVVRGNTRIILDFTKVDGRILLPAVAYSCCRPGVGGQCLHDLLQQKSLFQSRKNSAKVVVSSIYTEGCLPMIVEDLRKAVTATTVFVALICGLQVILIAMVMILHGVHSRQRLSNQSSHAPSKVSSRTYVKSSASPNTSPSRSSKDSFSESTWNTDAISSKRKWSLKRTQTP